ncbi:MAG: D-alanyl-D-alanine carboxypeptidase [Proteobacteria bacterium]|nr:D-alanyl-D-alanine carboxypeptidase [Pseudomonadota bacterium]
MRARRAGRRRTEPGSYFVIVFAGLRRFAFSWIVLCLVAALAAARPAAALETLARQAILVEEATGAVLLEKNADELMAPSSMSKLMTVYMVFERLAEGTLALDDTFLVSEKAWRKSGSKMFVEVGKRVTVEDLLRGIIVQSGNDACIVVAEGLSGSEEAFAAEMTERGREIGLRASVFKNSSGWPEEGHVMTARDLAWLAHRTIRDFPQYYHYYAETSFTYNGIRQGNRNPLLYRDMGADGLKTGHTVAAGHGLVASSERDGRRLILVINGLEGPNARLREAERLLDYGYRAFGTYALFENGATVTDADVWLGDAPTVPLVIENDLAVTLLRAARRKMEVKVVFEGPVPAPIARGEPIAKLVVSAPGTAPIEVPLVAGADVGKLSMFRRLGAAIGYLVWGSESP